MKNHTEMTPWEISRKVIGKREMIEKWLSNENPFENFMCGLASSKENKCKNMTKCKVM